MQRARDSVAYLIQLTIIIRCRGYYESKFVFAPRVLMEKVEWNVWAKERQLHLAQKDLKKLKEQLKNAETTKAQVLVELEKAKRVVEDLSQKLKVLGESRESAIQATEASKNQAKQLKEEKCGDPGGTNGAWKEELETAVNNYASVITELDVAKKELSKIRQGYDLSSEARVSALKQAAEAEDAMKANTKRACELSKEILAVQESVEKTNAEFVQAHQLQEETLAKQKVLRQSYEAILEESKKKLLDLKKEFNPELTKNLEVQPSLDAWWKLLGWSWRMVELRKSKSELEARVASEEMILTLKQLLSETENAKRETEDMKSEAAELKMEDAVTKLVLEDAETKLKGVLEEVEAAKAAEASALDQIKVLSMRTSPSHSSTSEPGARITISREEFETLVKKVEESDKLADIKVAAATAQVEVAKASENEFLKRAEAAKRTVEGELRKWREQEQKKAAEAASRILAETLMSPELSPQHYRIQMQTRKRNHVGGGSSS
ncbi:WEB family protein [Glycine soja]|uniref:WEB family protein n=1 Tax=Glycine soja TaxID=3848 RepID=A0A0B2QR27_GLYSO|nr:WEB family protein [Glycine soja]